MSDDIPVAGEPSKLERFAAALTAGTVGNTELGVVQLYKVGERLVPLNQTAVDLDMEPVEPSEIRFVVNPHDHGAEATFVVSVTELDSPASPFPPPGPQEIERPGITVMFPENVGPQLWYGDGFNVYRLDDPDRGHGAAAMASARDLAIMDALLRLALGRVSAARESSP